MKIKTCIGCGKEKPVSDFYKSPTGDGFRARCGACHWAAQKAALKNAPQHKRDRLSEYSKQKARAWDKRHPFSKKARRLNRRAKLAGVAGRLTESDVLKAWRAYKNKCWICGCAATDTDHYRPTNKASGGTNTADNIRPVCSECNQKRSHIWRGDSVAKKEAEILKTLARLLNGGGVP